MLHLGESTPGEIVSRTGEMHSYSGYGDIAGSCVVALNSATTCRTLKSFVDAACIHNLPS